MYHNLQSPCVRTSGLQSSPNECAAFVERIVAGDIEAVEELYVCIRSIVGQQLRFKTAMQDPDDLVHELLMDVVQRLRAGELRNPSALRGYLHSVVRRQIATRIGRGIRMRTRTVDHTETAETADGKPSPERQYLHLERLAIINKGLRRLHQRESELIQRFYLHGEDLAEICEAMRLTPTQFRLFKSRAKAKLTAWAQSVA